MLAILFATLRPLQKLGLLPIQEKHEGNPRAGRSIGGAISRLQLELNEPLWPREESGKGFTQVPLHHSSDTEGDVGFTNSDTNPKPGFQTAGAAHEHNV